MRDASLNPFVRNLGRPFELKTYDSSASFPKRFCEWCGAECDILHEQKCKQRGKPEGVSDARARL